MATRRLLRPLLHYPPIHRLQPRLASTAAFKRVGFIGLGNMGSPMADNLLKAGYQLVVHDKDDTAIASFIERGGIKANTPCEVARISDAVITMLPTVTAVLDVYLGPVGLLTDSTFQWPTLFIDSSTVDPHTSRKLAAKVNLVRDSVHSATIKYAELLDAPVSGGVLSAHAGTLTFMVGGTEEGFKLAQPLFKAMGKNTFHCGASGNGAAAKVCNNLALAVSMAGISEALALGQQLGLNARTLSTIFNNSSARCWSSDTYNPVPGVMTGVPASEDYKGGFSCKLMAKDLRLAIAAAKEADADVPLATEVHEMYNALCEGGKAEKDFSSIFCYKYMGTPE